MLRRICKEIRLLRAWLRSWWAWLHAAQGIKTYALIGGRWRRVMEFQVFEGFSQKIKGTPVDKAGQPTTVDPVAGVYYRSTDESVCTTEVDTSDGLTIAHGIAGGEGDATERTCQLIPTADADRLPGEDHIRVIEGEPVTVTVKRDDSAIGINTELVGDPFPTA
jgi:hypothetical protein